jgi:hypothetical protein
MTKVPSNPSIFPIPCYKDQPISLPLGNQRGTSGPMMVLPGGLVRPIESDEARGPLALTPKRLLRCARIMNGSVEDTSRSIVRLGSCVYSIKVTILKRPFHGSWASFWIVLKMITHSFFILVSLKLHVDSKLVVPTFFSAPPSKQIIGHAN